MPASERKSLQDHAWAGLLALGRIKGLKRVMIYDVQQWFLPGENVWTCHRKKEISA
jgi:hypothetical protein